MWKEHLKRLGNSQETIQSTEPFNPQSHSIHRTIQSTEPFNPQSHSIHRAIQSTEPFNPQSQSIHRAIQSTEPKGVTNGLGGFADFIKAKAKEITKYHVIISLRFDAQSVAIKKVQLYIYIQRWTTDLNISSSQSNKLCAHKNCF